MKDLPLGIRLEHVERSALEAAARADQRPLSALGRRIITEWLIQHGWLEARDAAARPPNSAQAVERHGLLGAGS